MISDYKLIAFDVDGTLISNSEGRVIWQLVYDEIDGGQTLDRERFEAYMAGCITYGEWIDLDMFDWIVAGVTRQQIERVIRKKLVPSPGAIWTLNELSRRGYLLAVISGTLDLVLASHIPLELFTSVKTNRIWFDEHGRIDDWRATPFDMEGKAEALAQIAAANRVPLDQTVFVGDHKNDLYVLQRAGLAVAFEPKDEAVVKIANYTLSGDLSGLLQLL